MSDHFRLTLETTDATAALIALLRRHTGKSISVLRELITTRQPFLDETPHHNQYTAFTARVTKLLDDLDAEGVRYKVEIDGLPESPQYLRNAIQLWHDVCVETSYLMDLESDAPCIETLEWLKRGSASVFVETLRQVIEGDHYKCDKDTVDWARREFDAFPQDDALD